MSDDRALFRPLFHLICKTGENINREKYSNITIFVIVAFAFFLKLLICVTSKVDLNSQEQGRALLRDGEKPFLTGFELPKLVLCLKYFNCFILHIVLLNTSLTSVGGLLGYLC